MTIVEALSDERFLSGKLWARSVLWRKCGRAWRILRDTRDRMLSFGAPETPMDPYRVERYTSEWELVEPTEVMKTFIEWQQNAQ